MSGYGLSPYGIGIYGYATPPPSLVDNSAWAAGSHVVRVKLSAIPAHVSPVEPGDALNPGSWEVRTPDLVRFWTVLAVSEVDPFTYDIRVLSQLATPLIELEILGDLVTDTGFPFPLVQLPFRGCQPSATSTVEKRSAASGFALVDIRNGVGSA